MKERDLLAAIHPLAWPDTQELTCREAGHSTGHACLIGSAPAPLSELLNELSGRYGEPFSLVKDGRPDPTVTERTGLPLLAPRGHRLGDMYAWAFGGRWIGCGTVRTGDGVRPVVRIAERPATSLDGLPANTSWVERLAAITGWERDGTHVVDWAAAEARLGTGLPSDYKQLIGLFGPGCFDGHLNLYLSGDRTSDLVSRAEWLAQWSETHGSRLWEPHRLYPAPGGLLQWADTEQADSFYWLTDGPDPERWPIIAAGDDSLFTDPFHGSTAEYICGLLTDPRQPFSTARTFSAHWFQH